MKLHLVNTWFKANNTTHKNKPVKVMFKCVRCGTWTPITEDIVDGESIAQCPATCSKVMRIKLLGYN